MNRLFNVVNLKNTDLNEKNNFIISFDFDNTPISFYGDDVWDFKENFKDNKAYYINKKINYNNLKFDDNTSIVNNKKLLASIKEINYAYLSTGIKAKSLLLFSDYIFSFFKYVNDVLKLDSISKVSQDDLINYINYIKKIHKNNTESHLLSIINSIRKFWILRNHINDTLSFDPSPIINSIKHNSAKENKQTEIIPDDIWKSIVNLCTMKIDEFITNIEIEKEIIQKCNSYHVGFLEKNQKSNHFSSKYETEFHKYGENYSNGRKHQNHIRDVSISAAILIQAFTGMRISELLSLRTDCIIEEDVIIDNTPEKILKIKGKTFKYHNSQTNENGKDAIWLCPPIVHKAINALIVTTSQKRHIYNYFIEKNEVDDIEQYAHDKEFIFLVPEYGRSKNIRHFSEISREYIPFLEKNNIHISFKLTSHCFRRTFARFFAKCIIKVPIEALKEQFKHYSNHITHYYMKEDKKLDSDLVDMIEDYISKEGKHNNQLLFKKIKSGISNSILSVNNINELLDLTEGKQLTLVNNYMLSISEKNSKISAIDCLTCDGTIIIPDLHLDFWKDMLIMYDDIFKIEPNNIWYTNEYKAIQELVNHLENGNAYITKVKTK